VSAWRLASWVPRSVALRVAVGAAGLYAACVGLTALTYRSFLFPAPKSGLAPNVSGAELLRSDVAGIPVVALYAPPRGEQSVVVFFHGNGEELVDLSYFAVMLRERGLGLLFVEYPGYGLAAGTPTTEQTIYAAAAQALDDLAARGIDKQRVTLVGHSLGTGVAAEMAARGYGGRLVLISPFTSIPDMVRRFAPVVPVSWLVRDRFDTLSKAPTLGLPTLVIHGDADNLIPVEMARRVSAAISGARLEIFEGGGHNDLFGRDDGRLVRLIAEFSSPFVHSSGGTDRVGAY